MINSIEDLPIHLYEKIQKTGDLSLLGEGDDLEKVWEEIEEQVFKLVGLTTSQKGDISDKLGLIESILTYVETGSRFDGMKAKMEFKALPKKVELESVDSYLDVCISFSVILGFKVDYYNINVVEFFKYKKQVEEHGRSIKQQRSLSRGLL